MSNVTFQVLSVSEVNDFDLILLAEECSGSFFSELVFNAIIVINPYEPYVDILTNEIVRHWDEHQTMFAPIREYLEGVVRGDRLA